MDEYEKLIEEEKYEKGNNKLKWIGRILIIIGIGMILYGVYCINSFYTMFLIIPGIFFLLLGCVFRLFFANEVKIMKFQMQSMKPMLEEAAKMSKEIQEKYKDDLDDDK